jgi:uncharacterized HAD superfamily protein
MLLMCDIDSTLYDADPLFESLAKEYGVVWPPKANQWHPAVELRMEDGSNCSLEVLKRVFRKAHSREYVSRNKPYPNASKVLKDLVSDYEQIEIAYVSDRNEQQTEALRDWLIAYGFLINEDQHVVATKDKRDWMREHRPSIVIDDRVRTILMARYELGSQVIAIQHPHNVNLRNEASGVYVVKDWKEVDEVLRDKIIPELQSLTRELQTR